ncbi:STAS/SEC14 domain-containing protein [Saprospira sp. CCB-QB6]|uniref:DUF7793 family protein n=1 Tax=Saprospira sp. CCB-QB6 TaxID=3023936 RepID=UPI002349AD23|nr:STAS/SEC14 domain-containing protein [Saprospira sp. CCB-QB6]WCL81918.1 STAS/SEC14 domain-containing protein [Saprospira sp. CCB-QB6]
MNIDANNTQIDLAPGLIEFLPERRLVVITIKPVKINAEDVELLKSTARKLINVHQQLMYILFDIRKIKGFTKDGRDAFSKDKTPMGRSAGILVGFGISRIVANFMLGLNKPPYPIRAFRIRKKLWIG